VTEEEMVLVVLEYWEQFHRSRYRKLGRERALREARACARLTRKEMDALKLIVPGMTDYEAWTETRNIFCFNPPPKIEDE